MGRYYNAQSFRGPRPALRAEGTRIQTPGLCSWIPGSLPSLSRGSGRGMTKSLLRGRGGRQRVIPETLAQGGLLDLAGSGVGDLLDEHHVVRHPPARDLVLHEAEDLVFG